MPRSKRSKLVTLAQTDKKDKENKVRIFDEIREALDAFKYTWVLGLDDIRTPVMQAIRKDWEGSKIIMGKKKVLQKALGNSPETEYKDNLHKLTEFDDGLIAILLTDETPETVSEYFTAFVKNDYARAKTRSPISFELPEGIIYSRGGQVPIEEDVPMSHSMEPTLRTKFKLPTKMVHGKITLTEPVKVVEKGQVITVTQALIMKTFGIAAAEFKVKMYAYHDGETNEIVVLKDGEKMEE
ncbi:Mrt4 protein [Martiniozyma asiatica (nom. inval.)]|nr:Mrt4 protein [Martiniozyma asiatica]